MLFSDVAGFTQLCSQWATIDVVRLLHGMFSAFDRLCDRHGVYKVETAGRWRLLPTVGEELLHSRVRVLPLQGSRLHAARCISGRPAGWDSAFARHMACVVPSCHLPPVTEEVLGPYATHWQPPAHRGRIHGGLSPEPSPLRPRGRVRGGLNPKSRPSRALTTPRGRVHGDLNSKPSPYRASTIPRGRIHGRVRPRG